MRVLCAIVILVACSGTQPAPAGPDAPYLVVPQIEHTARLVDGFYVGKVPYQYTNHGADTVVMTGCGPPESPILEWWTGNEWRPAYEQMSLMCLSPPFVVPPRTILNRTYDIHVYNDSISPSGRPFVGYWQASRTIGEYRLVWRVQDQGSSAQRDKWEGGALRPFAERVSNTFRIRMVPR